MVPTVIQALVDAGYRAIKIAASDSSSVAIGELGDLRVWGSFRVCDILPSHRVFTI
jgi:regulator of chromosome condensation